MLASADHTLPDALRIVLEVEPALRAARRGRTFTARQAGGIGETLEACLAVVEGAGRVLEEGAALSGRGVGEEEVSAVGKALGRG